ncbi:hypothetical protein [Aquincola sp. J276]|uniref:hypothetical protein n=1 Tax=Aquincola sp. J276 TaxID=2898432 RepID=UPI002151E784|nr:hypothetical protein [Aquincola sp. J276]MCR5869156.1 hypothetical protein [Aquincola sp. J276]
MRLLRVIMLWWMVLALPMQGLAATAMLHCGAATSGAMAHAGSHQAHQDVQHDGLHSGMDHQAHENHGYPAAATPDAGGATDGLTPDEPPPGPAAGPLYGHACSACAACCVAMGLPAAMPVLASAPAATTAVATLVAPAPSFLTAGPERPPRSPRA